MFSQQQLNDFVPYVYFYFITNISDISAFNLSNIVFSDNMVQDAERLGGTKEDVIGATAVTIHPNQTVNEIHILVDLNIINENYYELTRVLIHEFIHVYDFLQLGKIYFDNDMSNLEEYSYWDIFKLSSEFIAYSHADIYAQKFSEIINGTKIYELMSENYKENFPNYFKNICNQIHLDNKISMEKIFQLLGQLNTLDIYNNIPEQFGIYQYLPDLFTSERQLQLAYEIFHLCLEIEKSDDRIELIPNLASLVNQF